VDGAGGGEMGAEAVARMKVMREEDQVDPSR
jgi:hypothetical protein